MTKSYAKGGGRFATEFTRKIGTKAEKQFEQILISMSLNFRPAKINEELKCHYDYVVTNFLNYKSCKIEVKATKSPKRGQKPDSSILYLEIKSVGGHPGWIYGKADYIAFQIDEKFILFSRYDLVEYLKNTQDKMPIVKKSGIVGTKYGRKGRKDLVAIFNTKIVMSELKYIEISTNILEYVDTTVNRKKIKVSNKNTFVNDATRTYAQILCTNI